MALSLRTSHHDTTLGRTADGYMVDGSSLDLRRSVLSARSGAETMMVVLDGRPRVVTVEGHGAEVRVWVGGTPIEVAIRTDADLLLERFGLDAGDTAADREVRAPMPGLVLRMLADVGQEVEAGQGGAVLEAMKMENELTAPAAGTVAAVHVGPGDAVGKNDLLLELDG